MKTKFRPLLQALVRRLLLIEVCRRLVRVRSFQIVELGESGLDSLVLAPADEAVVSLPDYSRGESSNQSSERVIFPALKLTTVRDAAVAVNHRFSNLLVGDRCVIQDRREPEPYRFFVGGAAYRTAGIVGADLDRIFVRHLAEHQVPGAALYLGTRATYNWSHWLLNFLPSLFLINSESRVPKTVPVLVPAVALEAPGHLETLELFLEDRPVLRLEENVLYRFSEVFWPDPPIYDTPFAADKRRRLPLAMHRGVMTGFVGKFQQLVSGCASISDPPRRIFIARRDDGSRAVNMEGLRPVLEKWGFSSVYLEDYNIFDKARIMENATHVVGPSGSGFANLVFARPGLAALSFTNYRAPAYDNFVPNLAALVQAKISYISARPERKVDGPEPYSIEPAIFDQRIARMFDS
jgi:capsular polysaccharide biosynthesis protein